MNLQAAFFIESSTAAFNFPEGDDLFCQVVLGVEAQMLRGLKWIKLEGKDIILDTFLVVYLTLLYLLPLRFHCVGRCWDRTRTCSCDCQTL